jgi:HEPN domain-containing protein
MNEKVIKLVKVWIKKAENDLKTAFDELNTENPATDTICFHAQQCIEKYLKAYLIFHQRNFPKTHNISRIIEICKEIDNDFQIIYNYKAHELTSYAIEVRYGEEEYFPSVDEAREAVEIAKKVKEFVLKKLKERGFNYE